MIVRHSTSQRSGFSLLEVVLAMAILVIGVAGLQQVMNFGTDRASEAQDLNVATSLLQSTMNRVIAGDLPLSGSGDQAIDDDHKNWTYAVQADADSVSGLWHVTVTIKRNDDKGTEMDSWTMSEWVLDPSVRWTLNNSNPHAPPPSTN